MDGTGERIRALRAARGVGQADLAAAIGVSKSYLSHIEAGRRPVSAEIAGRLAKSLDVDAAQFEQGIPADGNEDLRIKLAFAELSLRNGEWTLAANEFEAVLARARTMPLDRFVDEAAWGLARAKEATGSVEGAIEDYERLLARPNLSAAVPRAKVSMALVRAYWECGDLARAVDIGEQALADIKQVEPLADLDVEIELISTVAGCYMERGDLTRARMLIDLALSRSGEDGSPRARAAAAWNAAIIADSRHDAVAARLHADRALALYSEIDNALAVALLQVVSAALRLRPPDPDPASALPDLERAIVTLQDIGTSVDLSYAYTEQARALLHSGDPVEACTVARQALQQLSGGDRLERGHALVVLGRATMATGAENEALEFFREAAMSLGTAGASRQAGTVWRELAEAYVDLDRPTEAIEALRHASDLAGATYNPMRRETHSAPAATRQAVTS